MKKLIVLLLFASFTLVGFSQGLFKTVPLFSTQVENNHKVSLGELPITHKWEWRLDGTIAFKEVNRNIVTKEWITTDFSAVGLAIGIQSYVPTSVIDPTPINNFGAAAGLALGRNIMNPNLAELKVVAVVNIWQYVKIGGTFTPNPPTNISKLGFFVGGGITF